MMAASPSIGVFIPTFRAAKHLPYCLPPLLQSRLKPRILIIDSSSDDDTVALAHQFGVETIVIPQTEFNHGITREKARHYLNTDIVVMITQDAYATSADMLEKLIDPLLKGESSIAYARQIPHLGAGFFESFPRYFNYPVDSHIRSILDIPTYGIYTFFSSNSCAAYLNRALDEVGGFPPVLFGEDTVVLAKLLHRQHKVAYVAAAQVRHSHNYSLKQEFCRHFDIGLARHHYQNLLAAGGSDNQRGKMYVKSMLKELKKQAPFLIPYAIMQSVVKLAGYRLGKASLKAPIWFKKLFSSQPAYWRSLS